jgi:organic hydroperoxide reductase OsmC/OhrA
MAGSKTIVVDRPEGKAGGLGLGFDGGQLLALAVGGCFCNDLRYMAEADGAALGRVAVQVVLEMEGEPLIATRVVVTVDCEMLDGSDPYDLIDRTKAISMVARSLAKGTSIEVSPRTR